MNEQSKQQDPGDNCGHHQQGLQLAGMKQHEDRPEMTMYEKGGEHHNQGSLAYHDLSGGWLQVMA